MTSTKRRYPHGTRFSSDVECKQHRGFGGFPCPWPECENGVPESAIYEDGFGPALQEMEYQRVEWPFDGESGFSWQIAGKPTILNAGGVASTEAVRRFSDLAKPIGLLYHYTDVKGLMGIVQQGGLWLTDANYMNDRREIEHGIDIAIEVLKTAVDAGTYAATADSLRGTLNKLHGETRPRVCVASLCEEGDNLSQWRAYGFNGSRVALGFEPFAGSFRALTECHLRRVVYDGQLQQNMLRMSVHFHHVALQHDRAAPPARGLEYIEANFSEILYNALYELLVCFKDAAFVDEREYRFVYSENWPADMVEMLRTKARYRVRGRLIVPYVAMSDLVSEHAPKAILPIREVVVGPQAEPELVARGIGEFLESAGYATISVRQSKTPFRPDL